MKPTKSLVKQWQLKTDLYNQLYKEIYQIKKALKTLGEGRHEALGIEITSQVCKVIDGKAMAVKSPKSAIYKSVKKVKVSKL